MSDRYRKRTSFYTSTIESSAVFYELLVIPLYTSYINIIGYLDIILNLVGRIVFYIARINIAIVCTLARGRTTFVFLSNIVVIVILRRSCEVT